MELPISHIWFWVAYKIETQTVLELKKIILQSIQYNQEEKIVNLG